MLLARTLKLMVVCGAAVAAVPAALVGCQKEAANGPATAASSGNGASTNTPAASPALPKPSPSNTGTPATRPSSTTQPANPGSGSGTVGGGTTDVAGGSRTLPPLPKMTPGTMPALPPMLPTTGMTTRPAFPSTQEFNK